MWFTVKVQSELLKLIDERKRLGDTQGMLGSLGTKIDGLFQAICSDGLSMLVFLFSAGLAFMVRLI